MKIKIGAFLYHICWKHRPRFKGKFVAGVIDYFEQRIDTYIGLSPEAEWVNLWHETIHGILHNAGIDDHDEKMVNALAHGICQVLVDNAFIHEPIALKNRTEPDDPEPTTPLEEELEYDTRTNSNTLGG
jgi:hypothetical protein